MRDKCIVLVPFLGYIHPETQNCLSQLIERGYVVRTLRGCSQIDLARSIMASQALQDGFTETFWIDSDVVFEADDVDALRDRRLPFVAGLYPKKGKQGFACQFKDPGKATFGLGGGILEMTYVGMGFTYIRAEVYETIKNLLRLPECGGNYDPTRLITPYFIPTIIAEGEGHCYLSEDYSFCYRASQAGYKIMADTTIRLGHITNKTLTWDDFIPQSKFEVMEMEIN